MIIFSVAFFCRIKLFMLFSFRERKVSDKSKFELSYVFSVAFLLLTFLFAKRKVSASYIIISFSYDFVNSI